MLFPSLESEGHCTDSFATFMSTVSQTLCMKIMDLRACSLQGFRTFLGRTWLGGYNCEWRLEAGEYMSRSRFHGTNI